VISGGKEERAVDEAVKQAKISVYDRFSFLGVKSIFGYSCISKSIRTAATQPPYKFHSERSQAIKIINMIAVKMRSGEDGVVGFSPLARY
jgi:hypothetical protein